MRRSWGVRLHRASADSCITRAVVQLCFGESNAKVMHNFTESVIFFSYVLQTTHCILKVTCKTLLLTFEAINWKVQSIRRYSSFYAMLHLHFFWTLLCLTINWVTKWDWMFPVSLSATAIHPLAMRASLHQYIHHLYCEDTQMDCIVSLSIRTEPLFGLAWPLAYSG